LQEKVAQVNKMKEMFPLDMRTAILSFILISIVSTFVVILLLRQYRGRYKGVPYILYGFAFLTLGLILILLRNKIPDWISFDLANAMSIGGMILFFIGIEGYMGKNSSRIPNLLLLIAFTIIHTWFTFERPNSGIRYLNHAIFSLLVFLQCLWLFFKRVEKSRMRYAYPVSFVFIAFSMVSVARIVKFFITGQKNDDFLNTEMFETVVMISYQVLMILLTYSISHMIGSQLLLDIKLEEEKFSKAFHTSPYAIILSRFSDGKILDINKGFVDKTGYSQKEVLGRTTLDLNFWSKPEDRDLVIEELGNSGKVYQMELGIRKKSGELITGLLSSEIISVNNEECIFSSIDDITKRKNHEEELLKSKEKAEESDRLKTAFMHNISHEIRTPLNAIVGFSNLLGDKDLDNDIKQSYIDLITRSSSHLLSLVSDIMEISNIEAGILKFNENEINLNVLLNDLYKQFKPRAVTKEIDLKITAGLPGNATNIVTDGTKLVQVLTNLLSNALKFTDTGQVEFGARLINDKLEFHVTDTGIGIPEEMQSKIFDRFYQVDYSDKRKYEGTGLGLSISKAYIELTGGKIWLNSRPGGGAAFYFTIPYIQAGQHHNVEKEPIC
jgi:PAS domain S-box-containing protein